MKKFLSLMLAMIMVMSLVTVGAGAADFTDAEEIQYVEAVELMSALKILEGPGDGTFNPKGTLTRGAAAKIIAYISQGADIAADMTYGGEITFSDVPATSATAPYIAWCAENGIINGHTDGTFRRSEPVSGYAFLKMVLNAMGRYGTYTGAGWQVRVANEAVTAELLTGIEDGLVNGTNLTRELAAQIAFNALTGDKCIGRDGYLVEGEYFGNKTDAMIHINIMKIDEAPKYVYVQGGCMLNNAHKVEDAFTGVVIENSANKQTELTTVKAANGTTKTFGVNTGLELLGSQVTFYYKDNSAKADFDKTGYTYVAGVENGTEITVTGATTAAQLKTALAAVGITENVAKHDVVALNANGTVGTFEVKAITLGTTKGEVVAGGKNESVTLIVIDKQIVGAKETLDKKLAKIEKIDTTADKQTIKFKGVSEAVKNGYKETDGTVTDVINTYEGMAKDDLVIVTKIGAIYNLEKATTVTGKVTKIDGTTVTMDGVAYAKDGATMGTTGVTAATIDSFSDTYTLYLDGQGKYIVAKKVTTTATKTTVFFLEGVDGYAEKDGAITAAKYAKVMKMDGTIENVKVADYAGLTKRLYEIQANADTGLYTFADKGIAGDSTITAKDITADISGYAGDIYYYAEDVKFIAVQKVDGVWKTDIRTGVQNVETATWALATKVTGTSNYTVSTVVFEGTYNEVAMDDIVYAVDTAAVTVLVPYTNAAGNVVGGYQHTVYVNGVKTTIITNDGTKMAGFYQLTKNGEGYTAAPASSTTDLKLYNNVTIANVYKTMITIDSTVLTNNDVADAEIIDLRSASKLPEGKEKVVDATGLEKNMTVSVVVDNSVASKPVVVTIFVVGPTK